MDKLEFQDLPFEEPTKTNSTEHKVEFTEFPAVADGATDANVEEGKSSSHSIFTLQYYQQFFDVDTFDVGIRMFSSFVPNPKRNYLEHFIRPKPDLYGPFWICCTLTFCIGVTGNVADFFAHTGVGFNWRYDFHKVSIAATVIFCYWLVIPVLIWGLLRWRGSIAGYTLTELTCIYGYSLSIFIPVSVLWLIQVTWVQLSFAVISSLLSGLTLMLTLYPAVKNDSKQILVGFLIIILVLHALLATGFVKYFFIYGNTSAPIVSSNDTHSMVRS